MASPAFEKKPAPQSTARIQERRTPSEPFPLLLHRKGAQTARAHAKRELQRVGVLLSADALVLVMFRGIIQVVRDDALLGDRLASFTSLLVPAATISVPQTICAVLLGLFLFRNYRPGDNRRNPQGLYAGAGLGIALVLWSRFWIAPSLWTIVAFGVGIALLGSALALERFLVDVIVRRVRPVGSNAARTLLVGTPAEAERARNNPALVDGAEAIVVGYLDVATRPAPDALGGIDALVATISAEHVDTVILLGDVGDEVAEYVLDTADAASCQVYKIPHECVNGVFVPSLYWRRGVPMLQLTRPWARSHQLKAKRILDAITAAVALVGLAPVLVLIAAAVRFTSRGPILFTQERVGIGGRRFNIFKFRTMVTDAERQRDDLEHSSVYTDGRLFKVLNDPRVTPVGRFLRRTSLDELPQLWNVLRGEMSLVGPRPPLPCEVELYDEHHYRRFVMKPGITGPWQVSGRNTVTDFEEVVRLEAEYMRNWTLRKDFRIMARTVPAVFKMEGAH